MGINKNLKKTLITGGRSLVQTQVPYAPFVTATPPVNDPQSQDGSLVVVNGTATDGLYGFDARTQPGSWKKVADVTTLGNYNLLGHNITPVTVNANTTADQNLMSYAFSVGYLNTIGKTIRFLAKGIYTTSGAGVAFTLKVKLSTTVIVNVTVATPAALVTDLGWRLECVFITQATGATGKLEVTDWTLVSDTVATATCQTRLDANTGVSGSIDLTAADTLQIICAYGSASASNSCTERILLVESLN